MRILAIETVETTGSVAVLEGATVLAARSLDGALRSARSLAPGIEAVLGEVDWSPRDVQLVAVATGPGSFTGLRIGVTTAKVFAYASAAEVIGVHTMAAIAARVPADVASFSVAVDAQRGELFVADFHRDASGVPHGTQTTRIVVAEPWLAALPAGSVVTGPGLAKWAAHLREDLVLVDAELWPPTAAAVGEVGWQAFSTGQRMDVMALCPSYFRRTAAEEQWERLHAPAAGSDPAV